MRKRFELLKPTHMVTVTLSDELPDAVAKRKLRWFRRWLRRHHLYEHQGWVREYGEKRGRLHFHMLMRSRSWLPLAAMQIAARRSHLGNLDVRRVGKRACRYVAKYCTGSSGPGRRFSIDKGFSLDKAQGWRYELRWPLPQPGAKETVVWHIENPTYPKNHFLETRSWVTPVPP